MTNAVAAFAANKRMNLSNIFHEYCIYAFCVAKISCAMQIKWRAAVMMKGMMLKEKRGNSRKHIECMCENWHLCSSW